ncbi:MAG: glycoside hydrolase family 127 protein [Rikenellaceae bacterium]
MKKRLLMLSMLLPLGVMAQQGAYIGSGENSRAVVQGVNIGDVEWRDGFWKERFDLIMPEIVPAQYDFFMDFAENNFRIIVDGIKDQGFKGTHWQDGDYYKWLEAQVMVYSMTKDKELYNKIQECATLIAKSIADDGYSTTHTQIGFGVIGSERKWDKPINNTKRWVSYKQHETYNMGHLLTLACTHYRVTGDRTLLDAAIRVGDYLDGYFKDITPQMADVDYNQTQLMGLMELYRCTGEERYLDLVNRFISARGNKGGRTQNQNDTKLREESRAVGHAVLGPVMYSGAADYVAERNDPELFTALKNIWDDIYTRKASFTGGIGNVHNGPSQSAKTNHNECTHEAFGHPYHIQSATAYNETCATYYGAYFSWRMFLLTGETKYLDVMEKAFYNNLSAMQLDGKSFFYTNVLRWYGKDHNLLSLDFHQRWTEECTCVCCPTSVVRFLAETKEYAYAKDDKSLFVTLYGSNDIKTEVAGNNVEFIQHSDYPWSDQISMTYNGDKNAEFSLKLRIPAWATGATLKVGVESFEATAGEFAVVDRKWKRGDKVELMLPMRPILNEANPMVEEVRGQVALSYGPLVYCVEGKDLPKGVTIDNLMIDADSKFDVEKEDMLGGVKVIIADGVVRSSDFDKSNLYAPLRKGYEDVKIKFIPYYAWSNRGEYEMSVFLPIKW